MTMNWKQMETANGAGADVPAAATQVLSVPERRIVRPLRWKQDAVCREHAAADADLREADPGAEPGIPSGSSGTSVTRTNFYLIPHSNSTDNPKGNPKHNPEKKGKQTKTSTNFARNSQP